MVAEIILFVWLMSLTFADDENNSVTVNGSSNVEISCKQK